MEERERQQEGNARKVPRILPGLGPDELCTPQGQDRWRSGGRGNEFDLGGLGLKCMWESQAGTEFLKVWGRQERVGVSAVGVAVF